MFTCTKCTGFAVHFYCWQRKEGVLFVLFAPSLVLSPDYSCGEIVLTLRFLDIDERLLFPLMPHSVSSSLCTSLPQILFQRRLLHSSGHLLSTYLQSRLAIDPQSSARSSSFLNRFSHSWILDSKVAHFCFTISLCWRVLTTPTYRSVM